MLSSVQEGGKHMRAIIVDDEPIMLKSFMRLSKDITDLEVVGEFKNADDAVAFVKENPVELAFRSTRGENLY